MTDYQSNIGELVSGLSKIQISSVNETIAQYILLHKLFTVEQKAGMMYFVNLKLACLDKPTIVWSYCPLLTKAKPSLIVS